MAATESNREFPIYVVDAFTKNAFAGNPAAVCVVENDQNISDENKQKIANEMNLSETVFVSKINPEESFENAQKFRIRWFTPTQEIPMCGHATLAASAVLFSQYGYRGETVTFETMCGPISASRQDTRVVLNFPREDVEPVPGRFTDLAKVVACNLPVVDVQISPVGFLIIRLDDSISKATLENLSPDTAAMIKSTPETPYAIILTLKGSNGYDLYSRVFAPWIGVNEDPVCGSAHTALAPYWARVLGKKVLNAHQCSKRGGDVYLKIREDGRVDIGGDFQVVLKGSIFV